MYILDKLNSYINIKNITGNIIVRSKVIYGMHRFSLGIKYCFCNIKNKKDWVKIMLVLKCLESFCLLTMVNGFILLIIMLTIKLTIIVCLLIVFNPLMRIHKLFKFYTFLQSWCVCAKKSPYVANGISTNHCSTLIFLDFSCNNSLVLLLLWFCYKVHLKNLKMLTVYS